MTLAPRFLFAHLAPALLLTVFTGSLAAAQGAEWQQKVDPWVLDSAARSGAAEALVFLIPQADLGEASRLAGRTAKGRYVYQQLVETARRTQPRVLAALAAAGIDYRPFWIANAVWVRGDLAAIEALARRADVSHLYANPRVAFEEPLSGPEATDESVATVEWGIDRVDAPVLWSLGSTGQGVVIAGQDTGYDWDHTALIAKYRGWDGATASHDYNWHDAVHSGGGDCGADSPEPCDDHGHGTHTMGTMVGDDGEGNAVGMAPGARWIGCRNMDEGFGTPATYAECFQFFLAPTDSADESPDPDRAPDIVNNSWSCPPFEGCTDPEALRTIVENTAAAGIAVVSSAGNSGPACASVDDPPAIYDASFAVGATRSDEGIASFSSRGPVTTDGSSRLKPDAAAPGVGIRSSQRGGGYTSMSGTSMAAPHVAGLMALLICADPDLRGDVETLEGYVRATAEPRTSDQDCGGVPGSSVPNNTYGHGAVRAVPVIFYDGMETGGLGRWSEVVGSGGEAVL